MSTVAPIRPQADMLKQEIARVFALQQKKAIELRRSTAKERIEKIRKLRDAFMARREDVQRALYADFRKPTAEADIGDVAATVIEANHTIRHLKRWMKPVRVAPTQMTLGTFSHVRYEPKGVCLIIAPWNYPVTLLLEPLVSAIGAGNTAILKPSEMTPNTSKLMAEFIRGVFPEDEVAIFEGDADVSTALLEMPFDHCFFTGSPAVGKIVMAAAAKHLTSVTLELGGKSPTIVDATANVKNAAASIAFGKFANCGQTCIAPDYVMVHDSVKEEFTSELQKVVQERYGDAAASPDYARIVNNRHWSRIKGLLDDAVAKGAKVAFGGNADGAQNFIAPTVITNVPKNARIAEEEIFGPVLPVIGYKDTQEVLDYVNAGPKPLALYVYSKDNTNISRVIEGTSSGDAAINTCLVHFLHGNLPFGGANNSGIGKAHGYYGFKAFSHERAVLRDRFASTLLLAPPYTNFVKRLIDWTIRFFA